MAKVFKTTNSQIRILRERGMIIKNGSKVKKLLERDNYYNIINGYKDLFLDKTKSLSSETYIENTDFLEIYALYLFDREIRSIFLKYILEIENNMKAVLAYEFSKKYWEKVFHASRCIEVNFVGTYSLQKSMCT